MMHVLGQAPETGQTMLKAVETGGVAAGLLVTLTGCLWVVMLTAERFWKRSLKPFLDVWTSMISGLRDSITEANDLVGKLEQLHERKLMQSPAQSVTSADIERARARRQARDDHQHQRQLEDQRGQQAPD